MLMYIHFFILWSTCTKCKKNKGGISYAKKKKKKNRFIQISVWLAFVKKKKINALAGIISEKKKYIIQHYILAASVLKLSVRMWIRIIINVAIHITFGLKIEDRFVYLYVRALLRICTVRRIDRPPNIHIYIFTTKYVVIMRCAVPIRRDGIFNFPILIMSNDDLILVTDSRMEVGTYIVRR